MLRQIKKLTRVIAKIDMLTAQASEEGEYIRRDKSLRGGEIGIVEMAEVAQGLSETVKKLRREWRRLKQLWDDNKAKGKARKEGS